MKLKTAERIFLVLVGLMLLSFLAASWTGFVLFGYLGGVFFGLSLLTLLIFIRCPWCGRYVGHFANSKKRRFCPFCGEEIDPEDYIYWYWQR